MDRSKARLVFKSSCAIGGLCSTYAFPFRLSSTVFALNTLLCFLELLAIKYVNVRSAALDMMAKSEAYSSKT